MKFKDYFHEAPSKKTHKLLKGYDNPIHKVNVWNTFVDFEMDGVSEDDFSIIPRLIPESYFPTIERTCKEITTFLLKLITLPESEVKAIIPKGPVRDYLIHDLKILNHRPERLTGSFRFDMAIVGKPSENNPPQLLEVNELGFDGLARSTYFQKTMLDLIPELKKRVISLDTAVAEVKNMQRLGNNIARIQYDCYNWDEEYLKFVAKCKGMNLHLVSPNHYKCKIDKDFPLLEKVDFHFPKGRTKIDDYFPDAVNLSLAFTTKEFKRDHELYEKLIQSSTPLYGSLLTTLVASKSILMLLADKSLRSRLIKGNRFLDQAILPAFLLPDRIEEVRQKSSEYVIKHADGFGGAQVFMDQEMLKKLKSISPAKRHEWVVQKKTKLNTVDVNGILSRRKKVISDLGVFVHYDWQDGKFRHFEVGGLMSRGTNKGLKVNVSSGGLQVAVMLEKGV